MSISIGTSQTPSVRDTHTAWLRLRAEGHRFTGHIAGDRIMTADEVAGLRHRDTVTRAVPSTADAVLI